jgi:beta-lactam-binding protein with PASTA domain
MHWFLKDKRTHKLFGGLVAGGAILLFLADLLLMPWYTNYGAGITVPDVKNLSLDQAIEQFEAIGLRYEVYDERPSEKLPPGHILDQTPSGGTIVKPNRKIYLMTSAETRPTVGMPSLVGNSLDNARIQLQVRGLKLGAITYESSPYRNSVLRQSVGAGADIRRGTVVNLVIGDGVGQRKVPVPDLLGLRLSQAQIRIRDAGLRVGDITYEASLSFDPNHVIRFTPAESDSLFEGTTIHLVIAENPNVREEIETGVVLNDSIPRFR